MFLIRDRNYLTLEVEDADKESVGNLISLYNMIKIYEKNGYLTDRVGEINLNHF